MIPKIIHYAWFSMPANYPSDVIECIESWKNKLPDYKIMLWNAENFDFSICQYVQEAYNEGKYAFASDYVRLWALYNYGGIYLDSDIEVLKNFDTLLDNKAFTGFEDTDRIAAWIFGSEKGNPLFKEFMDDYKERRFILDNGQYDLTPNPEPITNILKKHGLVVNGDYQKLENITIYPMDYFCPYNPYRKSGDCFTERTYANHHFNGTWKKTKTENEKKYAKREKFWISFLGNKLGRKVCRHIAIIRCNGLKKWYKKHLIGK